MNNASCTMDHKAGPIIYLHFRKFQGTQTRISSAMKNTVVHLVAVSPHRANSNSVACRQLFWVCSHELSLACALQSHLPNAQLLLEGMITQPGLAITWQTPQTLYHEIKRLQSSRPPLPYHSAFLYPNPLACLVQTTGNLVCGGRSSYT